jgi:hypothetical protein
MFQKAFVVAAVFAVLAAMSSVAEANLILIEPDGDPAATVAASFTALGAQGFGNAPRMLTLQTNGIETGSVTPVDVVHDDAVAGANKSTTPTLGSLGWNTGANVGIGFNSDQSNTGITMQSLVLTIYAANGTTVLGTFSLANSLTPLLFTQADLALQQGNGNSVFNFGLTDGQQTTFNALVAQFGTGLFAGLASQLGCPAGAPASCLVSNDGPDSFIGFVQPSTAVIPEPGTLLLAGTALVGVMAVARKKLHRTGTPGSA